MQTNKRKAWHPVVWQQQASQIDVKFETVMEFYLQK